MAGQTTFYNENLDALFSKASSHVREISSTLSEQQLLEFYAYYKQAVEGPCSIPKPSWYQMGEKLKWQAWSSLKNMDSKEAMRKYIDSLNALNPNWLSTPLEKQAAWVHHSSMENTDERLEDSAKTVFDWVKEGNLEKVQSLLCNGFDINKQDENGLSLIHWAADRGSLEIVKYIVQNFNVDINNKDYDCQTPLHYASSCDHEEVVKFLLEAGADSTIKDCSGQMPCDVSENSKVKKIFELYHVRIK